MGDNGRKGKRRKGKRFLAVFLSVALLIPQVGTTAFAERVDGGLCEHHPEHIDCSYREAVAGHPCKHSHTENCYTDERICGLADEGIVDEIISDEDEIDIPVATDSNVSEVHVHEQECYQLDCPHERGDHWQDGESGEPGAAKCGYQEAVEGSACDYVCSICDKEMKTITIMAFDELEDDVRHQEVPMYAPQSDVILPGQLRVRAVSGESAEKSLLVRDVTWELIEKNGSLVVYDESRTEPAVYYYQAVLPEAYELGKDAELPEIEVCYSMESRSMMGRNSDLFEAANQELCLFINRSTTPADSAEYDSDAGCVRLLKDATLNYGLYIPSSDSKSGSTLDLNGHTLTKSSGYAVYLQGGTFSLVDSVGTGELNTLNAGRYATVLAVEGSQLTIRGATVAGDDSPLPKVTGMNVYSGPNTLTVEDCEIKNGLTISTPSLLVVEGGLTTDYLQGAKFIHIRNGKTLDLSNIGMLQGSQDSEITILSEGEDLDTATPLVRTANEVPDRYFSMPDPPEGYYLASALEGETRIWTLKEELPDRLKVTCTLPPHVKVQLMPLDVERGQTYTLVLEPDPGYVVKNGNIHVKTMAGGSWSERPHSYNPETYTLEIDNVQNDLNINILENIQLTYEDKPNGGSITVYGKNGHPIGADKAVAPYAEIRISAEADEGYSLSKILLNGTEVENSSVHIIQEPTRIEAEFTKNVLPDNPPKILQQDMPDTTIYAAYMCLVSASGAPPLTWSVSNEEGNRLPEGLKLNPETGVIYGTPVEDGTFYFTVTVEDVNGASASRQLSILVRKPLDVTHVTDVQISERTLTLVVGNTAVLTAKVLPDDAYYKKVAWQSDNPAVATVNKDGIVTAVKEGTANISVITEDGGKTDTCVVTVTVIHVAGVQISERALSLVAGNTAALTAKVLPDDAYNKKVVWQSDNPAVATVDTAGLVTAIKVGTANITVTTEDGAKTDTCVVTVTSGRSSSGGGSDSGSSVSSNQALKPDTPELAVIELAVTGSPASALVDGGMVSAAIAGAEEAARQKGRGSYGISVQYNLRSEVAFDGFSVIIKREALDRLIAGGVKWLTIHTDAVDLSFDLAALKEIAAKTVGDITLSAARETNLAGAMRDAVGTRPAYRLTVGYTGEDGRPSTVSDFGSGRVTVELTYTSDGTEQPGGLYLVYGDEAGGVDWLTWSGFNQDGKGVSGVTGHFSLFGVGYRPVEAFADTADHPNKTEIDFVVSRGLLSAAVPGTEGNASRFEPDGVMTGNMIAEALRRMDGLTPSDDPASGQFQDIPDGALTREQMAVILKQYADKHGYSFPVKLEAENFADSSQISSASARSAVLALQQAGVMGSRDGSNFAPKDNVSRAEAAVILRKFLGAVISNDKIQDERL